MNYDDMIIHITQRDCLSGTTASLTQPEDEFAEDYQSPSFLEYTLATVELKVAVHLTICF